MRHILCQCLEHKDQRIWVLAALQRKWKGCSPTNQFLGVALHVLQSGHAVGSCRTLLLSMLVLKDSYLHLLLKGNVHNQQKSFCQPFYACVCVCVCVLAFHTNQAFHL